MRALQQRLAQDGYTGAVIHGNGVDQANVLYFTGFPNPYMGDVVLIVGLDGDPALVTDAIAHGEPMHTEIYQTWLSDVRCSPNERGRYMFAGEENLADNVLAAARDHGLGGGPVGLGGMSAARLGGVLARGNITADPRPIDPLLLQLRAIKSPAELDLMRRAGEIGDKAFRAGLVGVRPGAIEQEVAGAIAGTLVREGAEPLYMIQVGSGPRSGFRNVRPTGRRLDAGDMVYIGFGLRHQGYCMRIGGSTAVKQAGPDERRFLEANVAIVEDALRAARPGVRTSRLVEIAEAAADAHGVSADLWAGGHGIGAHTHDLPVVARLSEHELQEGMTFVFEPMLIRAGFGTANAERVYAVTATGVRALSDVPFRSWTFDE